MLVVLRLISFTVNRLSVDRGFSLKLRRLLLFFSTHVRCHPSFAPQPADAVVARQRKNDGAFPSIDYRAWTDRTAMARDSRARRARPDGAAPHLRYLHDLEPEYGRRARAHGEHGPGDQGAFRGRSAPRAGVADGHERGTGARDFEGSRSALSRAGAQGGTGDRRARLSRGRRSAGRASEKRTSEENAAGLRPCCAWGRYACLYQP